MSTPFGELMAKYESIRPQLADAALAYLAEREGIDTICTLDRRDFSVYRRGRKHGFHIVPKLAERLAPSSNGTLLTTGS
jgi:hypothetical protein